MREKIISLISIILVILVSTFAFLFIFYDRDLKYKSSVSIRIGDKVPKLNAYVDSDELKRVKDKKINFKRVKLEDNRVYHAGKYEGFFNFKDKKIKIFLKVIDDIKPVINGVEDISIYVNEDVDLLKNITVSDNSHDKVNLEVNGTYDKSKVGEYQLSYVATDKSGNKTESSFKVVVKEKTVTNNNLEDNSSSMTLTSSKGYSIEKINGIYYVNGILIANKTYSLPSSYNPNGLLSTFMDPFYRMQRDALNEGVNLFIVSGFRSYSRQEVIYNNYVNRDEVSNADRYSARPGYSEHQSGLAADINSLDRSFINTKEGQWLNNNCYKYGFIIRYPNGKENITGYMYEPWHIRYVGTDLATVLYNGGSWITLEEYLGITSNYSY